MTPDQFDQTLRQFLNRAPLEPFVVELLDGRTIEIVRPKLAFGGGSAGFLTPEFDLVEFTSEEVGAIRSLVSGAAS